MLVARRLWLGSVITSTRPGLCWATALIDAAISLAYTLHAPGISLAVHPDNPRAKGLYEHLGFEHVGSHEGHFVMLKRF